MYTKKTAEEMALQYMRNKVEKNKTLKTMQNIWGLMTVQRKWLNVPNRKAKECSNNVIIHQ